MLRFTDESYCLANCSYFLSDDMVKTIDVLNIFLHFCCQIFNVFFQLKNVT